MQRCVHAPCYTSNPIRFTRAHVTRTSTPRARSLRASLPPNNQQQHFHLTTLSPLLGGRRAACAVVTAEMAEALRTRRATKFRNLTPDESMGALEWACGKVRTEYGLQMRNNK